MTVQEVARFIVKQHLAAYGKTNEYFRKISESLEKMRDPDLPIHFNSPRLWEPQPIIKLLFQPLVMGAASDETYIRKVDDNIVVSTSQHIDVDELRDFFLNKNDLSKEFYDKFEYIDEYGDNRTFDSPEDFEYYYNKFQDFLILENGLTGRHDYVDNCPFCNSGFSRGWKLKNGQRICVCQVDKILTKISRKEKLIKINED
jgi:hypothetical protein